MNDPFIIRHHQGLGSDISFELNHWPISGNKNVVDIDTGKYTVTVKIGKNRRPKVKIRKND